MCLAWPFQDSVTSTLRWAVYGAVFGVAFPLLAAAIRTAELGSEAAWLIVQSDPLFWVIASAPIFLGAFAALGGRQNDRVRLFSDNLAELVAQRTAALSAALSELARENDHRAALLRALPEGILLFEPGGALVGARSDALESLLPGACDCTHLDAFCLRFLGTQVEDTASILELLWDESGFDSPFEPTANMLGTRALPEVAQGRDLRVRYAAVRGDDLALEGVLVIVEDKTRESAEQRRAQLEAERVGRLAAAAGDAEAFASFALEADQRFAEAALLPVAAPELKRELHTLKGTTSVFGFCAVARSVHELEDALLDEEPADFAPRLEQVALLFQEQVADVRKTLSLDELSYRIVHAHAFSALQSHARAMGEPHLSELVASLLRLPLSQRLRLQQQRLERVAQRMGISLTFEYDPNEGLFSREEMDMIEPALVHVLNNALAHGARGRRELRLSVSGQRTPEMCSVCVRDDGSGIDDIRLVRRAVANGIWTEEQAERASERDRLELVFEAGISSRDDVCELAGRGEGLAAARTLLRARGGDLRLLSGRREGVGFELTVPAVGAAQLAGMPQSFRRAVGAVA